MITSDHEVEQVVLHYLEKHPFGADTLESITEFWLERRRVRHGVEMVSRAIARLIDAERIERFDHSGTTLFRVTVRDARRSNHAD